MEELFQAKNKFVIPWYTFQRSSRIYKAAGRAPHYLIPRSCTTLFPTRLRISPASCLPL